MGLEVCGGLFCGFVLITIYIIWLKGDFLSGGDFFQLNSAYLRKF